MAQDRTDTRPAERKLPPSEAQRLAINEASGRVAARKPRLKTDLDIDDNGSICRIGPEHADHDGWLKRMQDLFGTHGMQFPITQLNHLLHLVREADGRYDENKVNALMAAVEGAQPTNEVEAMLAVQMAGTHEMTMHMMRRAMRVDQINQFESAANMAVKLMRTFTMQVEALAKLQRGGQQVVKVVHVHSGAQAVVGNVISGNAPNAQPGGGSEENDSQPHAKGELPAPSAQPMPPLRRADEERAPVPFPSSGGQGAVQNARRRQG